MARRKRPRHSQPLGVRLLVVGLTGFSAFSQGVEGLTANRRWQWFWIMAAVGTLMLLSWVASSDPGGFSKKFW